MSTIDRYGNDMDTWADECAARADHEAFLDEVRRDETDDDLDEDPWAEFNAWMRGAA